MKYFRFLSGVVLLGFVGEVALAAPAGPITVKGSDTMVPLAKEWAKVYMAQHPAVKIEVSGGGTVSGFNALFNQATDLCLASRKIKAEENQAWFKAFARRPLEYKVAMDGLTIFVHPDNPVEALTLEQLTSVFTGKSRNWREFGGLDAPITLYRRDKNSGSHEMLKEKFLHGGDFAPAALIMADTTRLIQAVLKDRNGLGYGGAAYGHGARALAIKKDENAPAVAPSEETVAKRSYPIWRYLYLYVDPNADKGQVAAFLNWVRSGEGQKVVKETGCFPLSKTLQE